MKKKIIVSALVIFTSLLGIFSLSAANNRIKIVNENYDSKQLSQDGMHITNIINTANTDLVNGNIAIDIIIDNSKHTEIFYAIDNGKTMSSVKGNVIDNIKTNAKSLEEISNIQQGIVTTTDGNTALIPLDSSNIEMQLDTVKASASSTSKDGEIFDSIDKAIASFTDKADEKMIIVALSSMPTDTTGLKEKINNCTKNGIKVIVYGINLTNTTTFKDVFDSATRYELRTDKLGEIKFLNNVMNYLPQEKPAIATSISFDNYILNNFNIKDIKTDLGQARYDNATNKIIWEAGNIKTNQVVRLTYYLSLKSIVDESIIESIDLRTNRQIIVTQSGQTIGTYPADDQIDDQICSPTIMILREAIDNPKTGVTNYVVLGACLLSVAAITIIILNRKNQFNRI